MSSTEVEEFYNEIPVLMTHFPHMYMYQKQMMEMQRRQMMAEQG